MGRGKILDIYKAGPDLWIYSMWHDEAGHYEMGVSRRMHIQIIEIEGDIIGREIAFRVEGKEISIMFTDERKQVRER